jgi:hypothetical protein
VERRKCENGFMIQRCLAISETDVIIESNNYGNRLVSQPVNVLPTTQIALHRGAVSPISNIFMLGV